MCTTACLASTLPALTATSFDRSAWALFDGDLKGEALQIELGKLPHTVSILHVQHWPYFVVLPNSNSLELWNIMILVIILLLAVTLPIEICFEDGLANDHSGGLLLPRVVDHVTIVVFLIDMCLNFLIAVQEDQREELLIEGREIARRYILSQWFFCDLLSIIPFDQLTIDGLESLTTVKIFKLLRLFRLSKAMRQAQKMFVGGVEFGKLICIVCFVIHWVGCGWNRIGEQWRCKAGNIYLWEDAEGTMNCLHNQGVFEQYTTCVHQAVITLFGGGIAFTPAEQIYLVVIAVVGAIMQASVFGAVANLLRSLDEEQRLFESKVAEVMHRMNYLSLPVTLQTRVLVYYESLWNFHRSLTADANSFIDELSPPLRMDVKIYLYAEMILKIPFIAELDTLVAELLISKLQTRVYMKGDLIMRKGEPGDWMAFVVRGQIAILSPTMEDEVIQTLGVGGHIGEISLLQRNYWMVDVKALTWVNIQILHMTDWREIKESFPGEIAELERKIQQGTLSLLPNSELATDIQVQQSSESPDRPMSFNSLAGEVPLTPSHSRRQRMSIRPNGRR